MLRSCRHKLQKKGKDGLLHSLPPPTPRPREKETSIQLAGGEQDRTAQGTRHSREEIHPCLELEKGVLPGSDPRCLEHEAQGIGDEKASLWGQDGHSLVHTPFYMNSLLGCLPSPLPCSPSPTRTTGTA